MPTEIIGVTGSGLERKVCVTNSGELVTSALHYDNTVFHAMSSTGTAYSFYPPLRDKQFVITGFIAVSDKNVGANDALVEIYEANSVTSTVVQKALPTFAITKNSVVDPTGLRILVQEGFWVNAKTDIATINMTMFGYYINRI